LTLIQLTAEANMKNGIKQLRRAHFSYAADDCMDAGGRATHGAVAEGTR